MIILIIHPGSNPLATLPGPIIFRFDSFTGIPYLPFVFHSGTLLYNALQLAILFCFPFSPAPVSTVQPKMTLLNFNVSNSFFVCLR